MMTEWVESRVNGRDRVGIVGHSRRLWGMRVVAFQEGEKLVVRSQALRLFTKSQFLEG